MLNGSYEFSVEGMKALRADLKALKQNIESAKNDVLRAQLDDFKLEVSVNSPLDLEYTLLTSRVGENSVLVEQQGEQVLYTEFGTGWIGEISPRHPQEGETPPPDPAWGYSYSVNITQKDVYGWTYMDRDGQPRWTQGVPAGMQNYLAFQHVVQNLQEYANIFEKGVKK